MSGAERTRLPVAAAIALRTAGAATEIVGSPTPPQTGPPEGITVKEVQVVAAGRPVRVEQGRDDSGRLLLKLGEPLTLEGDQTLQVVLTW